MFPRPSIPSPLLLGFCAMLAACTVGGCAARSPRAPTGPSFSVLSINVYYGLRRGDELPAEAGVTYAKSTIDAMYKSKADIVCVQEADERWWNEVDGMLSSEYPYRIVRHDVRGGGFAVFSRWPVKETACLPPCDDEAWHQVLIVEADTPVGRVQLVNLHLTPPIETDGEFSLAAFFRTPAVRYREMARVMPKLDPLMPTLVVGDFNEGDCGDAVAMLKDAGFTDALPLYRPLADTWRYRLCGPIVLGRRLDHVMYEPPLDALSADLYESDGSDHRATKIVFEHTGHQTRNVDPDRPPVYQPAAPGGSTPAPAVEEAGPP